MKLSWLYIFLGGGLGSLCRYYLSNLLNSKQLYGIPWGTLGSNVLACFILGFAFCKVGKMSDQNDIWIYFISIGFCGGFSTFSTFSKENYELFASGAYGALFLYLALSLILGFLAFLGGYTLG
jgi:CrcB protein